MTISIIIPVYNAEKYLVECLDSVVAQTFTDFEVLLINDGSTDSSGEICDEYARKDKRFTVYHQQNSGVSAARNLGLENAKGKWVWFVDPDDFIRKDALEILQRTIEKHETEGIIFGYQKMSNSGNSVYHFDKKGKTVFLNQTETLELMYNSFYYPYQGYVWSKLFKKSIIEEYQIKFNTEIFFNEDRLFCFEYFAKIKDDVAYVLEDLYFYVDAEGSAMNRLIKTYNPKFETDIHAYMMMQEIVQDGNFKKVEKLARIGNIFASKRLFEMRRKFKIPFSDIDIYLQSILIENFKWSDYIGRNFRLGYFNWRFIKSIKNQ